MPIRNIGLPEFYVLFVVLNIVGAFFYIWTLRRTLERCAPESRTISLGFLWFLLIPLFNIVWHFVIVINLSNSLHNEFTRRNIAVPDREPGKMLGLATSMLGIVGLYPLLGIPCAVGALICWAVYWVKIAGYSRMLLPPAAMAAS